MPNPKLETYKNKATGTVYDYTDAAAQAALADILDGTDIDSFSDVETALATKVDKVTGKGLSTNDYDNTEKAKVAGAFPRSEQAVLGAENLFDMTKCVGIDATVTQIDNGFRAQVNNHTWGSARRDFATPAKNTLFTISCHANVATAGNFMKLQVYGSTDGSDYSNSLAVTDIYTSSKDLLLTFNSGNYNYLRFTFYLTNGTATSADVTFENPMFNIGSVALDYVPYAMTNRELTEKVQGITVKSFTSEQFTVTAGQYSPQEISIANGDLIPLGIVGYRIDGNGNTECGMWKNWMDISTKKALFGVKNFSASATATVTVTIFVLYKG